MCTVCPVPPNSTAACTAATGTCAFACSTGFADCDKAAANGCEINLTNDSANCGACAKACVAPQTCVMSACQ